MWNGEADKVALTVAEPLRLYFTPEGRQGLKVSYSYTAPLKAPLAAGQEVGTLTIEAPGYETRKVPLVTAADVPETGLVGRIMNAVSLELFGYEEPQG